MPSNDKKITDADKSTVKASQATTLLLIGGDSIFYYTGLANYSDYKSLKQTSYVASGLRAFLLKRNADAVSKIEDLKQKKLNLKISQADFTRQVSEIKNGKNTPVVIIKATDKATYKNLIDALDEMQICSIGKYVIDSITKGDRFLMRNLQTKGAFARSGASAK